MKFALPAAMAACVIVAPLQAQDIRTSETTATSTTTAASADDRLAALTDEYYAYQLDQYHQIEEGNGSTAPGNRLPSVTPEANLARAAKAEAFLARLGSLDKAALGAKAKVDAAVFRTLLEQEIGDARFREWEMPFDSDSNFWSYLAPRTGYTTVEEYERYIARMRDLPRYFDEHIANARAGLARGFSVPRVTLDGRDASIASSAVENVEESPFWTAFAEMPERIPAAEAERLKAEGRAAIAGSVAPAYAELLAFFRDEYLPRTRTTLAAEEMPDGAAYYQQQIEQYTTLDLTAPTAQDRH